MAFGISTHLSSGIPSGQPNGEYSAFEECNFVINEVARKADRYKRKARWSAFLLTASTALVPVVLIVAEQFDPDDFASFLFGRLAPGLLAAFAAILGRWILLEQPHQRWTLYRHWQRTFEAERLCYRQGIGKYASGDRDDTLAQMLVSGRVQLDTEWSYLVPVSKELVEDRENA
ncbi:MAG TPA: DUF4231 domain-containing protein [Solirubrobacterales bacterium]|nr:DUF4231 domain-containing protein [Solirubrobacterales bacterium]